MSPKPSCFVAYPSTPPSLAETIEGGIGGIRKGQIVSIDGWKSTSVAGKFIMTTICKSIEARDVFICDLTHLNHNVLFELGYAVAKKRRIWILLDPSVEKSKTDYEKFKLLTTVGYSPYSNSHEIEKAFYSDEPYKDLESTIYREAIESAINPRRSPTLLYLNSGIETESSVRLSRRVAGSQIQSIVDDPAEVRIQTLSWYAQEAYSACAVIVHFLSRQQTGWRLHNAKNSFVSGLAYGLGRNLLMLAHEPYESPIDYRDLLKIHKTAAQCEELASSWLDEVEQEYVECAVAGRKYTKELAARSELQRVVIGDPIAEHESDTLPGYFVRTAAYAEALQSRCSIFIGRKGSGKTAILYQLAHDIGSDSRNHVCIVKPVGYELEGVLRMLRQALPSSEEGYLIESFWKFLIYTELAKSVSEALQSQPAYRTQEDGEEELSHFVEENASIITPDFSVRLDSVVSSLQDLHRLDSSIQQRVRMSELLHDKVVAKLRSLLGRVLEKKNRVAVLVDNLDKAWKPREDLPTLSNLLFGLLRVTQSISQDYEKSDYWRRPVNLSLTIFLRSDIFAEVIKCARERDKIPYSRIAWSDPEVLERILEERFFASSSALSNPEEVWSRYFCPHVQDIPTRKYLTKRTLPRPRDLIYLSKVAIAQAVNRGHTRVEAADVLEAEKKYSQYALDSIIVENGIRVEDLELLLYEFVGSREIITRDDVLRAMKNCRIPKGRLRAVIDLLCDLTFLGREVQTGRFEFLYNEEDKRKLQVMARRTARRRRDKAESFRINEAFHGYLEIEAVPNRKPSDDRK